MKKFDVNLFDEKGISLTRAFIEAESIETIYEYIDLSDADGYLIFNDILSGVTKGVRKSNVQRFRIEELNEEK